jgi:hypothetical protein
MVGRWGEEGPSLVKEGKRREREREREREETLTIVKHPGV